MTAVATEILIALLAGGAMLGSMATSLVVALVVYPRFKRRMYERDFPVAIPGWDARMSSLPPFHASPDDMTVMLDLMLDKAVKVKGYDRRRAQALLNQTLWEWVPADPELVKENPRWTRHIRDGLNRVIAGDTAGRISRVVYNRSDRLGHVAAAHEVGHVLHRAEKLRDYNHQDKVMWDIVGQVKEALK